MSAAQLTMFEPTGRDLAALVVKHFGDSARARTIATNYAFSGMTAAASCFSLAADASENDAFHAEMALQFEQLAGLS